MSGVRPLLAVVLSPGLLLAAPAGFARAQEATNRDQSGYTELHEEGFPLRHHPPVVPAGEARLRDDEIVIGVVAGGQARAYPVNQMWRPENEVLNDTLGGTPIAATWCPVAHSAVVYERRLEGAPPGDAPLALGAVGLENGVFILYDRATRSWWSQVAGRGVRGPMEGRDLARRPSTLTTWGAWRRLHPETTVFVDPTREGRRRFTEETLSRITLGGRGPVVNEDLVLGVEERGAARAYVLRELVLERVVNDSVGGEPVAVLVAEDQLTAAAWRRTVEGRVLTFAAAAGDRMTDRETGSTWDRLTGRATSGPLAGRDLERSLFTYALWYAWRSQRPGTSLWGGEPPQAGSSDRATSPPPQ
jgi:hypothetical protein